MSKETQRWYFRIEPHKKAPFIMSADAWTQSPAISSLTDLHHCNAVSHSLAGYKR